MRPARLSDTLGRSRTRTSARIHLEVMTVIRVASAEPNDLSRYVDLLRVADWLACVESQWRPGSFLSRRLLRRINQTGKCSWPSGGRWSGVRLLCENRRRPEVVDDDACTTCRAAPWATSKAVTIGMGGRRASSRPEVCSSDCVADNAFLRDYYKQAGFAGW